MSELLVITVRTVPQYRRSIWSDDVPSRPGWIVTCPEHPHLGRDSDGEPWGYAEVSRAYGVATRHGRTKHAGQNWSIYAKAEAEATS